MGGNKDPATRTDNWRGTQRGRYPLDPVLMARATRKLAAALRAEAAAGVLPDIQLTGVARGKRVSRAQAAVWMDEQAARWEAEVADGPLNVIDRERMGF